MDVKRVKTWSLNFRLTRNSQIKCPISPLCTVPYRGEAHEFGNIRIWNFNVA